MEHCTLDRPSLHTMSDTAFLKMALQWLVDAAQQPLLVTSQFDRRRDNANVHAWINQRFAARHDFSGALGTGSDVDEFIRCQQGAAGKTAITGSVPAGAGDGFVACCSVQEFCFTAPRYSVSLWFDGARQPEWVVQLPEGVESVVGHIHGKLLCFCRLRLQLYLLSVPHMSDVRLAWLMCLLVE